MSDPGPIKDEEVRVALSAIYLGVIEEGMRDTDGALAIDGEYDDAIAYLNLLYRAKAELEDLAQDYRDSITVSKERGLSPARTKVRPPRF